MEQLLINTPKIAEIIERESRRIAGTEASSIVCLASFDNVEISLHITGDPDQITGKPIEENIISIIE